MPTISLREKGKITHTMEPELYLYPLVILAGFIAGFINTLAGSGSLVSLPMLMLLGLPSNIANGTNRVAILLQNVVGVSSFKKKEMLKKDSFNTRGSKVSC